MALRELCGAAIESMTNGKDSDKKRDAYVDFLAVLFAVLLAFVASASWQVLELGGGRAASPLRSLRKFLADHRAHDIRDAHPALDSRRMKNIWYKSNNS
jgi:hypothetical protein